MYGIFTYVYHKNQPNVDKYTIHGWYGLYHTVHSNTTATFILDASPQPQASESPSFAASPDAEKRRLRQEMRLGYPVYVYIDMRYAGFLKWWVSPTLDFPTKNDQHLGCEMGVAPFKETPVYVYTSGQITV